MVLLSQFQNVYQTCQFVTNPDKTRYEILGLHQFGSLALVYLLVQDFKKISFVLLS